MKIRGFEIISKNQQKKDFNRKYKIKLPKRATSKSAGYDFFVPFDIKLKPEQEILIPTGIKAYMKDNEELLFFPRSSLGFKYYIRIANTIPKIDSDYYNCEKNEGHIFIKIRNEGNSIFTLLQGEAFCQASFYNYLLADGDNFEGEKRTGGIGSTNNKKKHKNKQ